LSTELDKVFVPLAYNLLQEFGKSMTLTQTTRGAKNWDTGVVASGSSTAYSIKGMEVEYSAREIDGKTVKFGDKKIFIYAQGLPTDLATSAKLYTLTIDSVVWNIETVKTGVSGEDNAYYELQVRR